MEGMMDAGFVRKLRADSPQVAPYRQSTHQERRQTIQDGRKQEYDQVPSGWNTFEINDALQ
jgi:hypothetical protein